MKHGEDGSHLKKQVKGYLAILQAAGCQQRSPAFGVDPLADPVPKPVGRLPYGIMADEAFIGQLFETFQLLL
jgi:hypothetical protein